MRTDILTPKNLFQQDIRYTIPLFQRPYVWTHDEQWEPLWDDVRNVAERYLEELENCAGNTVEAGKSHCEAFPRNRRGPTGSNCNQGHRPKRSDRRPAANDNNAAPAGRHPAGLRKAGTWSKLIRSLEAGSERRKTGQAREPSPRLQALAHQDRPRGIPARDGQRAGGQRLRGIPHRPSA